MDAISKVKDEDHPSESKLPEQGLHIQPIESSCADKFTNFLKLPAELQQMIWKHAIPGPRIIKLKTHVPDWLTVQHDSYPDDYDWSADQAAALRDLEFSTDTKPCGLLGACSASRKIILRVYQSVVESKGGKKIRFDGENDVILLCTGGNRRMNQSPLGAMGNAVPAQRDYSSVFSGIKRLMLLERQFEACEVNFWLLAQFRSLKELLLIPPSSLSPDDGDDAHWEAYQKQLTYMEVQAVLSFEDIIAPVLQRTEDWDVYETLITRSTQNFQNAFQLGKAILHLTEYETPKISFANLVWEVPRDMPMYTEDKQAKEARKRLLLDHIYGRYMGVA